MQSLQSSPSDHSVTISASITATTVTAKNVALLIHELQQLLPAASVIISTESQRPFECDGLAVYQQLPLITVIPETVEHVQAILACVIYGARGRWRWLVCWSYAPCTRGVVGDD